MRNSSLPSAPTLNPDTITNSHADNSGSLGHRTEVKTVDEQGTRVKTVVRSEHQEVESYKPLNVSSLMSQANDSAIESGSRSGRLSHRENQGQSHPDSRHSGNRLVGSHRPQPGSSSGYRSQESLSDNITAGPFQTMNPASIEDISKASNAFSSREVSVKRRELAEQNNGLNQIPVQQDFIQDARSQNYLNRGTSLKQCNIHSANQDHLQYNANLKQCNIPSAEDKNTGNLQQVVVTVHQTENSNTETNSLVGNPCCSQHDSDNQTGKLRQSYQKQLSEDAEIKRQVSRLESPHENQDSCVEISSENIQETGIQDNEDTVSERDNFSRLEDFPDGRVEPEGQAQCQSYPETRYDTENEEKHNTDLKQVYTNMSGVYNNIL